MAQRTKKGKRAGRPTKLTPEVKEKICSTIRAGNTLETAAAYAGVGESTLFLWKARGEVAKRGPFREFLEEVKRAASEAETRAVAIIAKAMKENWQAAAWYLERRNPQVWGRRDRLAMDHSGKVGVDHTGEVAKREEYHVRIEQVLQDPIARASARDVFRRLHAAAESEADGGQTAGGTDA